MAEFKLLGQAQAFAVSSNVVPPIEINKDESELNCVGVNRSKPVASSTTPPEAARYATKASVAISTNVVPESTIPAVVSKMDVLGPNLMLAWTPQKLLACDV